MLNFCSLYSGSTGNSLFIENEKTKILIDAGVSAKKILTGLKTVNTNIQEIDAILVTHEHSDHIRSLGAISGKYNIPVYATSETWSVLEECKLKISGENQKSFAIDKPFKINDIDIMGFELPHDAINPCRFYFYI